MGKGFCDFDLVQCGELGMLRHGSGRSCVCS